MPPSRPEKMAASSFLRRHHLPRMRSFPARQPRPPGDPSLKWSWYRSSLVLGEGEPTEVSSPAHLSAVLRKLAESNAVQLDVYY